MFPFLDSPSISQQEILDHKFAFAPRKWATTGAARCLTVDGFRTGFDFDDLIKRIAVRTVESRPASRHKRPHTDFLIVGAKLHSRSSTRNQEAIRFTRQARPALAADVGHYARLTPGFQMR
jgi:hypothetical protein